MLPNQPPPGVPLLGQPAGPSCPACGTRLAQGIVQQNEHLQGIYVPAFVCVKCVQRNIPQPVTQQDGGSNG